eukprot:scaffold3.g6263.t1
MAFKGAYDKRLRTVLDSLDDVSRVLDSSKTGIKVEHRRTDDKEATYAVITYHVPANSDAGGRSAVEKRIDDLSLIEANIHEATDVVAGEGKGLSDSTIFLRVYSPHQPDLTLVDLPARARAPATRGRHTRRAIVRRAPMRPRATALALAAIGITRVAVQGQPENIEEIVTAMIDRNIGGPMTVLLCIVPATVDFSTAGGIKLAKKHDPEGNRTMGVVTKIDLVERGSDILARLQQSSSSNVKLKLGFIPVRNRTTEELNSGTSLADVRAAEDAFFRAHSELGKLARDRRGIDALVQLQCIVRNLPDLKKQARMRSGEYCTAVAGVSPSRTPPYPPNTPCIRPAPTAAPTAAHQVRDKLETSRAELRGMEGLVVGSESEAVMRAQQLATQLQFHLLTLRQGSYGDLKAEDDRLKLARCVYDKCIEFKEEVEGACDLVWFMGDECFDMLKHLNKDTRGVALPNFLSSTIFRTVYMRRVFSQLEGPSLDLVARVREYVEDEVLASLVASTFGPFPRLLAVVRDIVGAVLHKQERRAKDHTGLQIRQQEMVLTLNHYYSETIERIREQCSKLRDARQAGHNAYSEAQDELLEEYGEAQFNFMDKIAASEDNEDRGLMEMQISLKAYGKVVLKRVYDNVALGAWMLLVDDVVAMLATRIQQGLHDLVAASARSGKGDQAGGGNGISASPDGGGGGGVLALMQEPQQMRRHDELKRVVASLEQAWAKLRDISMRQDSVLRGECNSQCQGAWSHNLKAVPPCRVEGGQLLEAHLPGVVVGGEAKAEAGERAVALPPQQPAAVEVALVRDPGAQTARLLAIAFFAVATACSIIVAVMLGWQFMCLKRRREREGGGARTREMALTEAARYLEDGRLQDIDVVRIKQAVVVLQPDGQEDVACAEEPLPRAADAGTQVYEVELAPVGPPPSSPVPRLQHLHPPAPLARHLAGLAQLPAGSSHLARTASGPVYGSRLSQPPLGRTVSEACALRQEVAFVGQAAALAAARPARPRAPAHGRDVGTQTERGGGRRHAARQPAGGPHRAGRTA